MIPFVMQFVLCYAEPQSLHSGLRKWIMDRQPEPPPTAAAAVAVGSQWRHTSRWCCYNAIDGPIRTETGCQETAELTTNAQYRILLWKFPKFLQAISAEFLKLSSKYQMLDASHADINRIFFFCFFFIRLTTRLDERHPQLTSKPSL